MNKTTINLVIVGFIMVSIFSMIIPFSSINAQTFVPNELQSQYPQPLGMSTQDYMYMMQMMQFYMNMFGTQWQDQVIKIYEDDDDDDHDHDDKKDRGDWKKWFKKHYDHDGKKDRDWNDKDRDDKKKYCEGKGKWNGHTCVTDNEKDREDWRDAVCDSGQKSKLCGNADKRDNKEEGDDIQQEQPDFNFISDENENNEVEEESEPEEKEEEEPQQEESKDDGGDGNEDDSGGDDNDDSDDGGDSDDDGGGDSDDSGGGGDDDSGEGN